MHLVLILLKKNCRGDMIFSEVSGCHRWKSFCHATTKCWMVDIISVVMHEMWVYQSSILTCATPPCSQIIMWDWSPTSISSPRPLQCAITEMIFRDISNFVIFCSILKITNNYLSKVPLEIKLGPTLSWNTTTQSWSRSGNLPE